MLNRGIFFVCIFAFGIFPSTSSVQLAKVEDQSCEDGVYPPKDVPEVTSEVIDLDVSPGDRYNDLATKKTQQVPNGPLVYTLPSPYKEEIIGLSKASGIPVGEVVLYNIFYEVFTVCTSIVAENKKGKLYHARNLDFGLFVGWDNKTDTWGLSEVLRPLVVNLDFKKGGKTLYKTVSFAGYVGVITGLKPGLFSLTLNERFNINGGYIGIIEWIFGKRDAKWSSFLSRDVLEHANSFSEAHDMLANTEVLAPVYYILGGNKSGEGVVVTRDRTKNLQENRMDPAKGKWFVLQTNYDFWKPPLLIDDRRTPGTFCMNKVGQSEIGFKGLYNVLSSQPVLNKLTTYTVLMQVNSGELVSYIRNCRTPCFPW
ncbi:acid ceramidase [Exaiptasia diaphana]|uniref:Acid ceramidase n=1 Tax=Exaiptasia diaphana TaxID=2652724 RepID=A0A913YL79_EXADI|nr:acid ceramidase [Exaiptasia diaphana]